MFKPALLELREGHGGYRPVPTIKEQRHRKASVPGASQGLAGFHYLISFHLPDDIVPQAITLLETPSSLLFFDQTTLPPTLGPLHLLFPVPGMLSST